MNLYQLYAFVTAAGWERSLSTRWPDAPLINNYRLLVFTNQDLPKLKTEYSTAEFKELSTEKTIEAINAGEIGPFICDINQARKIVAHFTPVEDEQNAV
ncbi:hypothetical protein PSH54_19180 [Pseudoalteromonas sp. Angola-30]|uniref:hypothetical protein n=1 Tax=Pseudoalteromonas sp. Angola-30 TaxID=3025341 RepID=UPI00235927AB|nr:hypothetical protein [Pseudoalteromonas sp. Angola-30]MDC9527604.1 hypothetical protein [Pseudoalteromonas sp. Angola-30]